MNSEKGELLKAKARKISILEGSSYSVSDGFGLRNVTPYALAIGANNHVIGLLSSLPGLLGNFSQLFTSKVMHKFSRKKLVATTVILQAIMWLFMILPGFLYFYYGDSRSPYYLVAIYTGLILFGSFAGPAWSSWMRDIMPEKSGRFFGRRNKVCGIVALISMLIAGFILDYFKQTNIFIAFMILFTFSFIFRGISGLLFLKQPEPSFKFNKESHFSFIQFVKKMPSTNFGRFVIFISLISFATAVSSPFFAVYVLKDLKISYLFFMILTVSSSLISLLVMPYWGSFADRFGHVKVLRSTGIFIFIIPFLYALTYFFPGWRFLIFYLVFIELFSGLIWSGFNLSSGNFVYGAVSRERMIICVSYLNLINGIGGFLGATLGGYLSSVQWFSFSSLIFVFIISGILRLVVYLLFAFSFEDSSEKFSEKKRGMFFGLIENFNLRFLKPRTVG